MGYYREQLEQAASIQWAIEEQNRTGEYDSWLAARLDEADKKDEELAHLTQALKQALIELKEEGLL